MRFSNKIYYGEEAALHRTRIRWRLARGAGLIDIYCIVLSSRGNDLLEIYNSAVLMQHYFRSYPPLVVGIASGYGEALDVTKKILLDVQESTGGFDVRGFFGMKDGGEKL